MNQMYLRGLLGFIAAIGFSAIALAQGLEPKAGSAPAAGFVASPEEKIIDKIPNSIVVTDLAYLKGFLVKEVPGSMVVTESEGKANKKVQKKKYVDYLELKSYSLALRNALTKEGYTLLDSGEQIQIVGKDQLSIQEELSKRGEAGEFGKAEFLLFGQVVDVLPTVTDTTMSNGAVLYKRGLDVTINYKLIDLVTMESLSSFLMTGSGVDSQLIEAGTSGAYELNRMKLNKDIEDTLVKKMVKAIFEKGVLMDRKSRMSSAVKPKADANATSPTTQATPAISSSPIK